MALGKLQKGAALASKKEFKILACLESYYKGEYSLGGATELAHMPLRAIMEFMQKYGLPFYSDESDAREGLRKLSAIKSGL